MQQGGACDWAGGARAFIRGVKSGNRAESFMRAVMQYSLPTRPPCPASSALSSRDTASLLEAGGSDAPWPPWVPPASSSPYSPAHCQLDPRIISRAHILRAHIL